MKVLHICFGLIFIVSSSKPTLFAFTIFYGNKLTKRFFLQIEICFRSPVCFSGTKGFSSPVTSAG